MRDLQTYQSEEFGSVRTVVIDDAPWFVAKDITDKLGYTNGRKAVGDHVDEEDKNTVTFRDSVGRPHDITVITESGLY